MKILCISSSRHICVKGKCSCYNQEKQKCGWELDYYRDKDNNPIWITPPRVSRDLYKIIQSMKAVLSHKLSYWAIIRFAEGICTGIYDTSRSKRLRKLL